MALFLHSSMAGSYGVDCSVFDMRNWHPQFMTTIERNFGLSHQPEFQYNISFYDDNIGEFTERWVNDYEVDLLGADYAS